LPTFSLEKLQAVLPDGIAIALLGAIESLLSAVVADGMHRSNCELRYRLDSVRRHLRYRHGGTNRYQRPSWSTRACLRHFSLRLSPDLSPESSVGRLHTPRCPWGRTCGRCRFLWF
jgi:hypothetical protein